MFYFKLLLFEQNNLLSINIKTVKRKINEKITIIHTEFINLNRFKTKSENNPWPSFSRNSNAFRSSDFIYSASAGKSSCTLGKLPLNLIIGAVLEPFPICFQSFG